MIEKLVNISFMQKLNKCLLISTLSFEGQCNLFDMK